MNQYWQKIRLLLQRIIISICFVLLKYTYCSLKKSKYNYNLKYFLAFRTNFPGSVENSGPFQRGTEPDHVSESAQWEELTWAPRLRCPCRCVLLQESAASAAPLSGRAPAREPKPHFLFLRLRSLDVRPAGGGSAELCGSSAVKRDGWISFEEADMKTLQ